MVTVQNRENRRDIITVNCLAQLILAASCHEEAKLRSVCVCVCVCVCVTADTQFNISQWSREMCVRMET